MVCLMKPLVWRTATSHRSTFLHLTTALPAADSGCFFIYNIIIYKYISFLFSPFFTGFLMSRLQAQWTLVRIGSACRSMSVTRTSCCLKWRKRRRQIGAVNLAEFGTATGVKHLLYYYILLCIIFIIINDQSSIHFFICLIAFLQVPHLTVLSPQALAVRRSVAAQTGQLSALHAEAEEGLWMFLKRLWYII